MKSITTLITLLLTSSLIAQEIQNLICYKLEDWEAVVPAEVDTSREVLFGAYLGELADSLIEEADEAYIEGLVVEERFEHTEDHLLPDINEEADLSVLGTQLVNPSAVLGFYRHRDCAPAWFSESSLLEQGGQMLKLISAANEDGLQTEDYHYETLNKTHKKITAEYELMGLYNPNLVSAFDILMTDAVLQYGEHMRVGKVDPKSTGKMYEIEREEVLVLDTLHHLLEEDNLSGFIKDIQPIHPQYKLLKEALKDFRAQMDEKQIQNIPPGKAMKLGQEGERIAMLRNRLAGEDTLKLPNQIVTDTIYYVLNADSTIYESLTIPTDSFTIKVDSLYNPALFDSTLYNLVVEFQAANALETDGVVGNGTLGVLNIGPDDQLRQILINLERWRWLPREMGDRYLLVNVAGFELRVMDEDTVSLTKRVCVGRTYTPTPIFSDRLRYIEFNPTWTVPYSISSRELLPKIKADPGYLSRNNMDLLSGGKKVNPYSVDWSGISRRSFPYVIRQRPGSDNALGVMKFMFPNRYNVYVHDTQSKKLFAKESRAFSHGCVRLEKPRELAEFLLDGTKFDSDKIGQILKRGKKKRVDLDAPLPILMAYFTVWVQEDGRLQFYPDVYKRDAALEAVFFAEE